MVHDILLFLNKEIKTNINLKINLTTSKNGKHIEINRTDDIHQQSKCNLITLSEFLLNG
jgi:hypothetical protein